MFKAYSELMDRHGVTGTLTKVLMPACLFIIVLVAFSAHLSKTSDSPSRPTTKTSSTMTAGNEDAERERQIEAMVKERQIETVYGMNLVVNPYKYQGKIVYLDAIYFKKMYDADTAILLTADPNGPPGSEAEILLTGVNANTFSAGNRELKVRVIGMIEGKNAFGGPVRIPHVHLISVGRNDASDPLGWYRRNVWKK